MAITPVNISRISHNLQTEFVLGGVRRNQRELFLAQARIATGRQFVSAGEDPIAASRALDLTQALSRQQQFSANAQYGENMLSAADSALSEIAGLLIEASTVASQNVSNLTSEAEREAEAEVVAAILRQIQDVGNRQFQGRYIFAGRETLTQPFVEGPAGVAYAGEDGELLTRLSDSLVGSVSMPGSMIFGALSAPIATRNLTPTLADHTRIEDIVGAAGRDIRTGTLVINEVGGAGVFTVDLTDADTIGDVVAAINDAAADAGAAVTAGLVDAGIEIQTGGRPVSVTDQNSGVVASDLGILTQTPTAATITGQPLTPRLTRLTPLAELTGGGGIDLDSGLIVSNGHLPATIDLSEARTIQDVINRINGAGVFVFARINEAGTGIEIFNQASGASLSIGENGGTTASDLGIRSLDASTPLSSLNFGYGVSQVEGQADLQIIARDGSTVDIDLDGATTLEDVITAMNDAADAAGVSVTASLASSGNGIQIKDGTGGSGELSVARLNLSQAADDLGFIGVAADGDTLVGRDVNPFRTEGILGALMDLERALRQDDTRGIAKAGERIDRLRGESTRMHGIIGARAHAVSAKRAQNEDAAQATEIFLSQVRDLDYAEAVTRLQAATTQLEAGLRAGALISQLSLMDFLR